MWYLSDIVLVSIVAIAAIAVGLYFVNRKASRKMAEQQVIIDKNKAVQSIFVIDKKKDKIENVNMPKIVVEQMPKIMKFRKLYFVKAKIGPQIMTLMCEKKVFNALPVKKNIKVDLVGIYIMGIAAQKTAVNKNAAEAKKTDANTGFFSKFKSKSTK